jgi:uncharacterized protein YjbI with pentapeptide repeats
MANASLLELLRTEGSPGWNRMRRSEPARTIDLRGATLSGAKLVGINLQGADLTGAHMSRVNLSEANLRDAAAAGADLRGAWLTDADLSGADLSDARLGEADLTRATLAGSTLTRADCRGADLTGARLPNVRARQVKLASAWLNDASLRLGDLSGADLREAVLSGADLTEAHMIGVDLRKADARGANLTGAILVHAHIGEANLSNARVYGVSAWGLQGAPAEASDLVITPASEPPITVDDLAVAQFVYLLLNNENVRRVVDTVGSRGVLILGRFTSERKPVLEALRDRLRALGFVPILFDFEKPAQRDFDETVKVLCGLSRFVIADITNPSSSPLELEATIPEYMLPFVPIVAEGERPFSMFEGLARKHFWVTDTFAYPSTYVLLDALETRIVPAVERVERRIADARSRRPRIVPLEPSG